MIRWLKKKLGYHVCEQFSQWERNAVDCTRPVDWTDGNCYLNGQTTIEFTRKWQQRHCLECGKIQQKRLEY
ncbi:MAG: hypothetical protein KGL39_46170 [Patescibacteria group bacterium]|nr:hypothetical protein [Patescibacteria group bacterium]